MGNRRITQAILLAAGLGTRLKPLTLTLPKPLLPLDGELLVDHQLKFLAAAGVRDVAINLHHLGQMIRNHVGDGSRFGLAVRYSDEPAILGTGGGIRKAASLLDRGPLVALNADALIAVNLADVIERHFRARAAATMVVKELKAGDAYRPLLVEDDGMVKGFDGGKHFYTGLQIMGDEFLSSLPPSGRPSCLIEDGYRRALAEGKPIAAFIHAGFFSDLGTTERYERAKRDIAAGRFKPL